MRRSEKSQLSEPCNYKDRGCKLKLPKLIHASAPDAPSRNAHSSLVPFLYLGGIFYNLHESLVLVRTEALSTNKKTNPSGKHDQGSVSGHASDLHKGKILEPHCYLRSCE